MKSYRYKVVDVFTTEALKGNALAVFPDDLLHGRCVQVGRVRSQRRRRCVR
jgi:predicted PhzF superfamily epimerase YddE/YHI9